MSGGRRAYIPEDITLQYMTRDVSAPLENHAGGIGLVLGTGGFFIRWYPQTIPQSMGGFFSHTSKRGVSIGS